MNDQHDFAIDADDLQSAADPPANSVEAPARESVPGSDLALSPKVVIQYRNRGLHTALLPPLLILLTAVVITSYQRQSRLRPLAPHAPSTKAADRATSAGRGRQIIVEGAGTGVASGPIMVQSSPPPPPPPPPASAPLAATEPADSPVMPAEPKAGALLARVGNPLEPGPFSPFDLDARDGLPPLPSEPGRESGVEPPLEPPAPPTSATKDDLPADSPELAFGVGERPPAGRAMEALDEPRVTKEQILQGIRVEADQKIAEQKNIEREMAQSKVREYYETFRRIQSERPTFHEELRKLLQALGDNAGAEINSLCDRYGRSTLPEVRKVVVLALNRSAARLKREGKIELLRKHGVPEPVILDFIANEEHNNINRRGGPRDQNEVRARAARILLTFPPAASSPSSGSATTPAPRSVAKVAAPPVPRSAQPPQ
jgi:hypothetical protein